MSALGPKPLSIVAHRAWREAQTMILAAASGGPRTLALIGAAGTGKTWLLDRLVAELRERGRQVRLEQRGEVAAQMPLGAVLLVDEASRLDPASLERMATQQRGLVILADVPAFAAKLDSLTRPPATITLPTLDAEEVPSFIAEWAGFSDCTAAITDDAVGRLIVHSGGTPRVIVQLAKAALAIAAASGRVAITGDDIDGAAALKLGALRLDAPQARDGEAPAPAEIVPPIIVQPVIIQPVMALPAPAAPERIVDDPPEPALAAVFPRRIRWRAAAALALPLVAACVVAGWVATHRMPAVTEAALAPAPHPMMPPLEPAAMAPAPEMSTRPAEPNVAETANSAATPAPREAAAALPPIASSRTPEPPPLVVPPRPQAADTPSPVPASLFEAPIPGAPPSAALPSLPEPDVTPRPTPVLAPPLAPMVAVSSQPPSHPADPGAPGLVFVAGPGDTLRAMYARVYRGRRPPSYASFLAANPRPVRPGAIVIFPSPPDGWKTR